MTTVTNAILTQIALRNLTLATNEFAEVQRRVSSGRKVDRAADNPASFVEAQAMRARIQSNESVATALNGAKGAVTIAATAVGAVQTTVSSVRNTLLILADEALPATQREQYMTQLKGYIDQIGSQIDGASFNGVNLIGSEDRNASPTPNDPLDDTAPRNLTISRGSDGGVLTIEPHNLKGLSNATTGQAPTGFLALARLVYATTDDTSSNSDPQFASTRPALTAAQAQAALGQGGGGVDAVFVDALTNFESAVNRATGAMGVAAATIDSQLTLNSTHATYLEEAVGDLVDTDPAADSIQYQALQVRQQLATQALSIANQNAGAVLALFR